MNLLNSPVLQFVDADGLPLAFAKAYLYLTGTTTPVDTYADVDMVEAHTFPIVADSQGIFPPIFYEGDVLVRMKLVTATGDLVSPLLDIDPVNQLFTVFAANIADGAIEEKLGYTPVDPATAVFTANARQNFEPEELNVDDIGFRGNPVRITNVDHTFELADSQSLVQKDDTSEPIWAIPPDTFPIGHYIEIHSANAAGDISLERGVGVVLRSALDGTDENKTIPPLYRGRLQQVASNDWLLSPDVPGTDFDLSAAGYIIFPNGYIRQWGKYTGAKLGDTTQAVVFPIEFPTSVLGANVSGEMSGTPAITADMGVHINLLSDTGLTVYISGPADEQVDGFYWEAWGH